MQIYGKNVAKEKLQTKDKIKKIYLSNRFNQNIIHFFKLTTSIVSIIFLLLKSLVAA